jgi:dihydropyrimidinase
MKKDESIIPVIEDYHKLANGQSYCDYAFHVIITNPTPQIVEEEFPRMVDEYGITSVKLYMTYKPMRLRDYQILDVMYSARKLGITTMVHAENTDIIDWMTQHLEEKLMTHPYHHGTSRPPIVEAEATVRQFFLHRNCLFISATEPRYLSGRTHGYAYPAGTHIWRACDEAHPRRTNETPSDLR